MAVRTTWTAGDVLTAADLTDTFAAKAPSASPTFTGTVDFSGATVTGIAQGLGLVTAQPLSAAASISVNNCFTSANDQFLLVWRLTTASGTHQLRIRMRASGTDNTSSYAQERFTADDTTIAGLRVTGESGLRIGTTLSSGYGWGYAYLFGPALAAPTAALAYDAVDIAAPALRIYAATHNVSTAYDGFTLYNDGAGTMTGAIRVYKLANA